MDSLTELLPSPQVAELMVDDQVREASRGAVRRASAESAAPGLPSALPGMLQRGHARELVLLYILRRLEAVDEARVLMWRVRRRPRSQPARRLEGRAPAEKVVAQKERACVAVVLAESASALLTTHCLTAVLPYYRTTSLPHYSPLTTQHSLLSSCNVPAHYSPVPPRPSAAWRAG